MMTMLIFSDILKKKMKYFFKFLQKNLKAFFILKKGLKIRSLLKDFNQSLFVFLQDEAFMASPKETKIPSPENATPVIAQWIELKKQEEDALLFFRMGDFYELFFHDAQIAATALDISLTKRGTHQDEPIPMCGVPVNSAQAYLSRLIRRGFRVAVAEQTETPQKGQKGPLKREIIRLITPGTLTEDELLDGGRANILLALTPLKNPSKSRPQKKSVIGAAWVDISTGHVELTSLPFTSEENFSLALSELLARLEPSEILAHPEFLTPKRLKEEYLPRLTPHTTTYTKLEAENFLTNIYHIAQLDALGDFQEEHILACTMLLHYVKRSQAGKLPRLTRPLLQGLEHLMGLDPATRQSLDLLQSRDGGTEHTVFNVLNQTQTASGMRLLAEWLSSPLTQMEILQSRQEGWKFLSTEPSFTQELRNLLRHTPDAARALGRISSGRALPRDLATIRDTLQNAEHIITLIKSLNPQNMPPIMKEITASLYARADSLLERLIAALPPELPARLEDGGVIAFGFNEELDQYRDICDDSRQYIAELQSKLALEYDTPNLRIKHHNQLGYIIEVPAALGRKLASYDTLYLRQGTANLARFSNDKLAKLDRTLLEANEKVKELERHFFYDICQHILDTPELDDVIHALALCDVLASCSALIEKGDWCCPELTHGKDFSLEACRHPIVEAALQIQHTEKTAFIPNNCDLPPQKHVMLLTGPNMAGKSTFLRQNALAVILAQAGLPLPAKKAKIGLVDRLFSRVGAADDLARGRSTFMVEMTETASILNQAGPHSLVVVDEIGRGTSTCDGLALAWATLEALHSHLQTRTIFATHFHELGALLSQLPKLSAYTMAVQEWEGKVIFQHEVKPGHAQKSWGLHVAHLAGIPKFVLQRASQLLKIFEKDPLSARISPQETALPLFYQPDPFPQETAFQEENFPKETESSPHLPEYLQEICDILATIDPDSLTPREAQAAIYRLKEAERKGFS